MSSDDGGRDGTEGLERRLEARLGRLEPREPRAELAAEVLGAVEAALGRSRWRRRALAAGIALLLTGGMLAFLRWGGSDVRRDGAGPVPPPPIAEGPLSTEPPPGPDSATEDDCPADPAHPPRLVVDLPPEGLDFGEVRQDVTLQREVRFRNEGTGPLCLRRIETGCGCIRATPVGSQGPVLPGEARHVVVILDTRGRDGRQRKTLRLYTNDPEQPVRSFAVTAAVTKGLRLSPAFLNLGRTTPGRAVEGVVRLRAPREDGEWTVTGVEGTELLAGSPVEYEWSLRPVEDLVDRGFDLVVRHPGLPHSGAAVSDEVRILTSHPEAPERRVRTYFVVVDPVIATPAQAVLGYVSSETSATVRLLPGDPDDRIAVLGARFEAPDRTPVAEGSSGFAATWVRSEGPAAAAGGWEVVVRWDGKPRPAGPFEAVLVIETDAQGTYEVRIPCHAAVR